MFHDLDIFSCVGLVLTQLFLQYSSHFVNKTILFFLKDDSFVNLAIDYLYILFSSGKHSH